MELRDVSIIKLGKDTGLYTYPTIVGQTNIPMEVQSDKLMGFEARGELTPLVETVITQID